MIHHPPGNPSISGNPVAPQLVANIAVDQDEDQLIRLLIQQQERTIFSANNRHRAVKDFIEEAEKILLGNNLLRRPL